MEKIMFPQKFSVYNAKLGTVQVTIFDFKDEKNLPGYLLDWSREFKQAGIFNFFDMCLIRIEDSKTITQCEFRFSKVTDGNEFVSQEYFRLSNPPSDTALQQAWEMMLDLFYKRVEYEKNNKCPQCDKNVSYYPDMSGVCYCKQCKISIYQGQLINREMHRQIA